MSKNKSATVGYKYYLGMHMVVSQSPVDKLKRIRIGEKEAWSGSSEGGQILIDKEGLFGGKERGGGWKGAVDVLTGTATQAINTYLSDKIGTPISAFRGVFSLAFNRNYIGNSPFLNRIAVQGQWVYTALNNWLPNIAAVPARGDTRADRETGFIYIAIDASYSMFVTPYERIVTAKAGVNELLESLKGAGPSLRLVTFGESATALDAVQYLDASDADIDAAKAWVSAIAYSGTAGQDVSGSGSNFLGAVESAPTFFALDDPDQTADEFFFNSILGGISVVFEDENVATTTNSSRVLVVVTDGIAEPTTSAQAARDVIETIPGVDVFPVNVGPTDTTYTDIIKGEGGTPVPVTGPAEVDLFANITGTDISAPGVNLPPRLDEWTIDVNSGYAAGHYPPTPFLDTVTSTPNNSGMCGVTLWVDVSAYPAGSEINYTDVLSINSNFSGTGFSHPDFLLISSLTQAQYDADGIGTILESRNTNYLSSGGAFERSATVTLPSGAVYLRLESRFSGVILITANWTQQAYVPNTFGLIGEEQSELGDLGTELKFFVQDFADRNPAHILRDLIVAPWYGGDGDDATIGDSYATAAQTLYDEGFGLSLFHDAPSQKADFQQVIEEHIDAKTYFDRTTGKWEIKLIRDDYTVGDLFTFDQSNITDWISAERPRQHELPNQITVSFTRRDNGESDAVTLHNVSAIQQVGTVIPETREYPGITVRELAGAVAMRDLAARTVPSWGGSFRATYVPEGLHPGFAFIIDDDRIGMNSVVCRITEIDFGNGRSNEAVISFAEDRFSISDVSLVDTDDVTAVNPGTALPPTTKLVMESPYYLAVTSAGEEETETRLTDEPDLGFLMATTDKPGGGHVDGVIAKYNGTSWYASESYDFAPVVTLLADIDADADSVTLTTTVVDDLYEVAANELIYVGDEIMRVDDISVASGVATITVGRGCLDTVPKYHVTGASAIFWYGSVTSDLVEYVAGETLDVRLLPRTYSETLAPSLASTDSVTFASRMIRPYPAGNFQLEAAYSLSGVQVGDLDGTWNHRDRLTQTTATPEDFADGDVGPEASVSYTPIRRFVEYRGDIFDLSDIFDGVVDLLVKSDRRDGFEYASTTGKTFTFTADDDDLFDQSDIFDMAELFENAFDANTALIELGATATRGGYNNWLTKWIKVEPLLPPINLTATEV